MSNLLGITFILNSSTLRLFNGRLGHIRKGVSSTRAAIEI